MTTPTITEDLAALSAAIEAGPTPGPWEFGSYAGGEIRIGPAGDSKHGAFANMIGCAKTPWDCTAESRDAFNDADYIAAASPDRIARLIAALKEARADQMSALRLVADLRFALGDNGKRMQGELIEWARGLAERDADRAATKGAA